MNNKNKYRFPYYDQLRRKQNSVLAYHDRKASNMTLPKVHELDDLNYSYLARARLPQSEQKMRRNPHYSKNSDNRHYIPTDFSDYKGVLATSNVVKSEIKSGWKNLNINELKPKKTLKNNISVENNLKFKIKKSSKTKRKPDGINLDIQDALKLRRSWIDVNLDPSPYKPNSLKNSYDFAARNIRNMSQEAKPKILIESLDTQAIKKKLRQVREDTKKMVSDALPSIKKHNKILPYLVNSKSGARYNIKKEEPSVNDSQASLNIPGVNMNHMKSAQIALSEGQNRLLPNALPKSKPLYNQDNSRNNTKLLDSNEGVFRAKSYNKWAKKKFLVIQDDFNEIDKYLLGDNKVYRGM